MSCSVEGCELPHKAKGMCSPHYNRSYYAERREAQQARARRWYAENTERVRTKHRAWYEANRDHSRAKAREWYAANRLRAVATAANIKARKLSVSGLLTADGIRGRFAFFGDRCWICERPGADSIDHVIPLAAGGPNLHSNIRPAHLGCNAARSWEGRNPCR